MYQSADHVVWELHRLGEQRMLEELERRRVVAERLAETRDAEAGVTDAASSRRGIRALLPRKLRPLTPPRTAES
ncbi:hypothetical protein [Agromyces bauzanensis]|uniref:Uncharacterized protein n=1 Tax=Agromyces bauzanensis TaxID=1308924 RepID=A0A917PKE2_9MICO|nr:hypothetical protein [Agromyces bauzanensis]GGJ82794.1 hypothetical protein GCM10011372_21360 [Agromyces bauzanensis]